jgi:competence ComEA-like helix-hairpin-helix protein
MLNHRKTWFFFVVYVSVLALPLMLLSPSSYAANKTEVEKIDINTAEAWLLAYKLNGIGEKKAIAIVEYREKHGLFQSIYDLDNVYGIGLKTIEKNKDKMMVVLPEEDTTEQTKADSPQTDKDETAGDEKNEETPIVEESTEVAE